MFLRVPWIAVVLGFASSALAAPSYLQGTFPDGQLGYSVADAGDVNDDGWPDLIVGAPLDDSDGQEAGRAFLWLGGAGLRFTPDLVFDDGSGFDHFGWSVCGAGDLNKDGYDDVAVGAPLDDQGGAEAGAVFIYFGGASMNSVPDKVLLGEVGGDHFGWSVSKGGDLDGDTFADLLVGAPNFDTPGQEAGAVYMFRGASGTSMSTSYARRFMGEVAGDHFGWAVSDVGDFKGDGAAGFVVGAPHYGLDAGRAYLFFGADGALPDTNVDVVFTNSVGGEEFGYAVSQAGRFNHTGFTDVLVGAPGYQGDRGFVRVFYGESNPASTLASDLQIAGEQGGDRFGASLADVGNHDGVGRDDFVVGAPFRNAGATGSGQVYLFNAGTSYTSASQGVDVLATNPVSAPANDAFGTSVSSMGGDLDGDGREDFLVGAPFANNSSTTVTGVGVLVGSGSGVVAVPTIPFAQEPVGTDWRFTFGGAAADAEGAWLYAVASTPRLLAELGNGIVQEPSQLVAEIGRASLTGVDEIELRWSVSGLEQSQRFRVRDGRSPLVLHRAWPNPFNPSTNLRFELPRPLSYELTVVDARGRRVRSLAVGEAGPGVLEVTFDGRDDARRPLSSGAYRAVLATPAGTRTTDLLLLK